jgi:hypothetical protein
MISKAQGKLMFLVAGYPASGKSTLLASGARGKVEVFGEAYNPMFGSIITAQSFDERITTREKLKRGLWFSLPDLDALSGMDDLPDSIAFHLDLLFYLIAVIRPKNTAELNSRAVRAAFEELLDDRLFVAYDRIVACTLLPDFELIQQNWQDRLTRGMELDGYVLTAKNDLIVNVPSPAKFYEGICNDWMQVVQQRAQWHGIGKWSRAGRG